MGFARSDSSRFFFSGHTLGPGQRSNIPGLGANIVDDGGLEPRDDKVSSFVVDLLLNSKDTRILDSTVTTVNYVKTRSE